MSAGQPAGDAPGDDHLGEGSADPAGADTVKAERGELEAERAELGAVGKPAP